MEERDEEKVQEIFLFVPPGESGARADNGEGGEFARSRDLVGSKFVFFINQPPSQIPSQLIFQSWFNTRWLKPRSLATPSRRVWLSS